VCVCKQASYNTSSVDSTLTGCCVLCVCKQASYNKGSVDSTLNETGVKLKSVNTLNKEREGEREREMK
jgi:hypothetical protein